MRKLLHIFILLSIFPYAHAVDVLLTPNLNDLTLSINDFNSWEQLSGTIRTITITNQGSSPANNVKVNKPIFPNGTSIYNYSCKGTIKPGGFCKIAIIPGSEASHDKNGNPCTTSPGTDPIASVVTVSADNAEPANINVLVLGYGCRFALQGGYLFSVDDTNLEGSISGKVASYEDVEPHGEQWADKGYNSEMSATDISNGMNNMRNISTDNYPAGHICSVSKAQNFTDWYLPAICELGRYKGNGNNPGCPDHNANLYVMLYQQQLSDISGQYWSSTEWKNKPSSDAWFMDFDKVKSNYNSKQNSNLVRCIRTFDNGLTPDSATLYVNTPTQPILVGSKTPLTLTVTSSQFSTESAKGVTVVSKSECPDISVVDDACSSLNPGQTCTIQLTSNTAYGPCSIKVGGTNTVNNPSARIAFEIDGGLVYRCDSKLCVALDHSNQLSSVWTTQNSNIKGAVDDNNGSKNTANIIVDKSCTHNLQACAAYKCDIYQDGTWYLPAINELENVYHSFCNTNDQSCAYGGWKGAHWSSTQSSSSHAHSLYFPAGNQTPNGGSKSSGLGVICIKPLPNS